MPENQQFSAMTLVDNKVGVAHTSSLEEKSFHIVFSILLIEVTKLWDPRPLYESNLEIIYRRPPEIWQP